MVPPGGDATLVRRVSHAKSPPIVLVFLFRVPPWAWNSVFVWKVQVYVASLAS